MSKGHGSEYNVPCLSSQVGGGRRLLGLLDALSAVVEEVAEEVAEAKATPTAAPTVAVPG